MGFTEAHVIHDGIKSSPWDSKHHFYAGNSRKVPKHAQHRDSTNNRNMFKLKDRIT